MMLNDNDVLYWRKSMGSCSEAFRLPCNLYRLANLTWAFLKPLCLAMQQVLK